MHRKIILDDRDALARSHLSGVWRGLDSEHLAAMSKETGKPRPVVSADIKNDLALADVVSNCNVSDDFREGRSKPWALFSPEEIIEITIVGLG